MNRYKILDPKGLSINGKLHEKGETITGEKKQAHIATALHFKQITEVKSSTPAEPDADADAKAKADARKKAESGK